MGIGAFGLLLIFVCLAHAAINASDPCGDDIYVADLSPSYIANLTFSTEEDTKIASGCAQIYPNVVIEKSFPGIFKLPSLESVVGSIFVGKLEDRPRIESSALTGVSFPKLEAVENIGIYGAADFESLNFPALVTISNAFTLADLPKLTRLAEFPSLSNVTEVVISNTGLDKLVWQESFPNNISSRYGLYGIGLQVGNNTNLQEINLDGLGVAQSLSVWGNGNSTLSTEGLREVGYVEVAGVNRLGSGGLLPQINGSYAANKIIIGLPSLSLYNNTFASFDVPNLVAVQNLKISNHPNLEFFSFPSLGAIAGDLDVTDNPVLKVINASSFGNITTVAGYLNFTGVFTDLSWLPRSYPRPQRVTILSTSDVSCAVWDEQFIGPTVISAIPYNCTSNGAHYTPPPPHDYGGSSGSGSSYSMPPGIIAAIVVSTVGTIIWAILMCWWCRRLRRRSKERKAMAAQVSTIAAAMESQKQNNSKPKKDANVKDQDVEGLQKPELSGKSVAPVVNVRKFEGQELGGRERERGAELENAHVSDSVEMAAPGHQAVEMGGGTQLSRLEEIEARERALVERENAAFRAREEVLRAREREVEELERQNSLIKPPMAVDR